MAREGSSKARILAFFLDNPGVILRSQDIQDASGGAVEWARLHIGHIKDRSHGGKDELSNLRALCSDCNQGAKNLVQEPPSRTWLLGQLRRATQDDQRAALDWLKRKFGEDGA